MFIACGNMDTMNVDQNSYYSTKPEALVTYAEKGLADYLSTPNVNTNNFRLVTQYWQETTYTDESNYDFVTRNIANNVWAIYYRDVMQNIVQAKSIINSHVPSPSEATAWPVTKKNQLAILDMQQVFIYQNLVDTFGDVPYQTSNDLNNNPLPAYSKGSDIYTDLITRLKADINSLDVTGSSFDSGDIFYGGDVSKWKIFGNSLLLKIGIAIADSNAALAQSTVNSAISGGVMTSSADDCLFQYLSTSPNYSQLYANLVASNRNDYVAGKTLVDYMNSKADPRRGAYFVKVPSSGTYVGATIGSGASFTSRSHIGPFAYATSTPGIILNYTEVAFYLAEAAARWNTSTPATAYANAVTASFLQWGFTAADAATYLTANPYDSTNWKKSVGEAAWVAMFDQGSTSWNFWRRLDYPVLVAPSTAVSQAEGKVPVRITYPVRETTTNPTNYAAGSASIGGDKLSTKIFWDKF